MFDWNADGKTDIQDAFLDYMIANDAMEDEDEPDFDSDGDGIVDNDDISRYLASHAGNSKAEMVCLPSFLGSLFVLRIINTIICAV